MLLNIPRTNGKDLNWRKDFMNRNNFINDYVRVNRKSETAYMPPVQRAIHSKVKGVISHLRSGGFNAAQHYLSTDLGNEKMVEVIRSLYLTVGKKHAQLNYSRLLHDTRKRKWITLRLESKGFGFNQEWADFINRYLQKFLTSKITFEIAQTTRDALLRTLSVMTMQGLSTDQAIEQLEDWPYERFQAARIVRTEVNRAANTGASAQASTSGWQQLKEWIAVHDNRTRGNPMTGMKDHANHWALDGTTIDEDDLFKDSRNGDTLQFPGDPAASAGSTVNCRCAVAYTFKRDAKGNLIPKRKTTAVLYPNQITHPQIITI